MRFHRILTILFILSLLATSCGTPAEPAPTPTQEMVRTGPSAGPAESAPPKAQPPKPTLAPEPTPTRAPLPPVVISTSPDRGQEQLLDAPVTITFDQPMDAANTSAAFSIEPKAAGDVRIKGNQLIFSPTERLKRDAEYMVNVGATASSAAGLRLTEPVSFKFRTAGPLQVTDVQPTDKSYGVPIDAALVVAFNRPVVPIGGPVPGASEAPGTSLPLVITPTVVGVGEWITTSIYRLAPSGRLVASTDYTVTVHAGLEDTTGGVLAAPYTYTFRTADPAVIQWQLARVIPREGSENVKIEAPITVTFSMPMDQASTEAAFKLLMPESRTPAEPLAGVFSWNVDGTAMSFKPARTLELGTRYYASVAKSAKPANGQGSLRLASGQEFTTVFPPKILRTAPSNGDARAATGGGIRYEFASPLNPASLVSGTVTILPKPTLVFTNYSDWDSSFSVNFDKLPNTPYTVTLSGKIADPYGNLLGQDAVVHFTTREYDPFIQLANRGIVGTYNAYTPTVAAVTYRNVGDLSFGLWQVSDDEFVALTGRESWERWRNYEPTRANLVREWNIRTDAPRNTIGVITTTLQSQEGQPAPPGLYFLLVDSETAQLPEGNEASGAQRQLIARTTLNVTLKTWAGGALAWITDLKSGQPVPGATVKFTDGAKLVREATSDADGIAQVTFDPPRQPWETLLAFAKTSDGGFGVASSAWTDGIGPWDFGVPSGGAIDPYSGYVYTDRPIYRPGQTVYWKALIRRDEDALYSLPAPGQSVTVTIRDGEGKELSSQRLTLDGMGTTNGMLALDQDGSLGYYNIQLTVPDATPTKEREGTSFGVSFQVAEYRKPEYEVSAQTDRPEYVQGEQIQTTVQANYFFGQPVKGAKVRWVLLTSDASFNLPEPPDGGPYSFADWDWYTSPRTTFGGVLSQGEGVTDSDGRYTFGAPADITRFPQSQRFTFDITILDANGQTVSTQANAIVHKAEFYIGLRPQSYVVTAGSPVAIDVLTVDPQGKPVSEVDVALVANRLRWYSVKEQAEDGQFYWVSKAEKTPVYSDTVTTRNDGTAVFAFTPTEPGEYKVEATARDEAGHAVRSATYAWVSGPDYVAWRQENNDRIQLVADKKEYAVGDTAQLLAASPYQTPVKALLTVERGGILSQEVIDVKRNSEVIRIPILDEYAPDVYASLILVKGMDATSPAPSFRMGLAPLKVSVADKQLQVILTPRVSAEASETVKISNTLRVGPRETMIWELQTLDASGKPISAEASLALVDKAVLSLADDAAGPMMDRFYRERGLGVTTGATLVLNIDRLVAQLAQGGKGGGGGDGGGADLTVRREFPDTAYWNATVKTGADGKATVELTLPDSLTTWTMDARAITAETQVGQSKTDVIATKDLLVRPVLPRFFIEGDKAEIAAIVHNNTQDEVKVEVKLRTDGLQVGAATAQNVSIKAGDTAKVTWPVTVQTAADQVKVLMSAVENPQSAVRNPQSDAVEITLPIHRYTTPEVVGSSGQVGPNESRLELFRLPPNADPTRGELVVKLEPSLAAGMLGSLDYLEHFPYECTEQTVSRFLPNVVTFQALQKLGIARPELATPLAQQVGVGLQRLYAGQHVDGGWGWWAKEESDPTTSSYVVLGLAKAKQAGFTVDPTALDRAIRYLKSQLAAPSGLQPWQLNQQAFMLYALAEAGAAEPNRAGALYERREALSLYGKATLALAFGLIDDAASKTRIQTLLSDITSKAITSGTSTHWEEAWLDSRNMNTDTRTTAIIIDALARLDPKNSLAPNAVRWLMGARQADHWETTQESAWAIMALTDWMAATGELEGDYSWKVLLNDDLLGQGVVKPATVGEVTTLQADIAKLLADQTNALLIQRGQAADQSGKGQLYYTTHLKTYEPVEQVEPLDRGVTVSREYRLADCDLPQPKPGVKPAVQAECRQITQAKVGDVIEVRLNIVAPQQLYYLIVEDPLPAGTEAIDTSLRTASSTAQGPEVQQVKPGAPGQPSASANDWRWNNWWTPTHVDLRDEKTALFATWLEPGSYEFRYQIRASLPGEFLTLPPTAYQMYHPEVWGRGAGSTFTVAP